MNQYKEKVERIARELNPRKAIREGERYIGVEFGAGTFRRRYCYEIRLVYKMIQSHYITGRVYERVIGRGQDFDSALANAREKYPV